MHKFTFSLEPLLKVKKVKKRKLERDMANAKQRLEEEQILLRQMKAEKASLYHQIERISVDGAKASKLKEYSLYFQSICERIDFHTDRCCELQDKYEVIRAALIDMHKHIDMLERLKTEQYRGYIYEFKKTEEKAMEELVNFNLTTRGERMHG